MLLSRHCRLLTEFLTMPRVQVDLMLERAAGNDPFFTGVVLNFYRSATARREWCPLLRRMSHGVALCRLPHSFDEYFAGLEASARRNYKKACREGCSVSRIQFNDHLDAVRDVRMSTELRQGRAMPPEYINGIVRPINDPTSNSAYHDFLYFGVFAGGRMIAYAACLVAGEYCSLEHILGHARYLQLGAVPLLIIAIARELYRSYPQVRHYAYGTYFGASETMRRFKRKFDFVPHRVDWKLGKHGRQPTAPTVQSAANRDRTICLNAEPDAIGIFS
jgi:hypothetical protein